MYQAKSGVKNFSLYWGRGGGVPCGNFFSSLNMYQAKSGVKKKSLCKKYFYKTTRLHPLGRGGATKKYNIQHNPKRGFNNI